MSGKKSLVVAALCLSLVPSAAWSDATSSKALEDSVADLSARVKAMEGMRAKGTVQDASVCERLLDEVAAIEKGLDAERKSIAADTRNATKKQKRDLQWVSMMNARKDALAKAQKAFDDAGLAKRIAHLCQPDPPKKGSPKLAPNSPSTR
jgi:hypothetical protein